MKWTDNQLRIINSRNKNICVSAGAGSGKTAVLIERIFNLIIEKKINITNILMITFTNKAALEMKNRLKKRLLEEYSLRPTPFIKYQLDIVQMSNISTIDSFTLELVRSFGIEAGVTNKFEIMDDKEEKIIANNAMGIALKELYNKKNHRVEILDIMSDFQLDKDDYKLRRALIECYQMIYVNRNFDDKFLEFQSNIDNALKDFSNSKIGIYFKEILRKKIDNCENLFNRAYDEISLGAIEYEECFTRDTEIFEMVKNSAKKLKSIEPLNFKVAKRVSKENKEQCHLDFMEFRKEYKSSLNKIVNTINNLNCKDYLLKKQKADYQIFSIVLKRFHEIFMRDKMIRNEFSFSDVTRLASELLEKPEIAKRYREYFSFVFVDEFQDNNDIQFKILESITRDNNLFIVGDIKQSIYRFRLANPQIFKNINDKYKTEAMSEAISLNRNFRTDKNIISGINRIFNLIMNRDSSSVDYLNESQLEFSSGIDEKKKVKFVELIEEDLNVKDLTILEAKYCAREIKKLISNKTMIFDNKLGVNRELQYKDIYILSASVKKIFPHFKKVFRDYDMPIIGEVEGDFGSDEFIHLLISFVSLIDNPFDDEKLLEVITAPFYNIKERELMEIREINRKGHLFGNLSLWKNKKGKIFTNDYSEFSEKYRDSTISETILEIVKNLNIFQYLGSKEQGDEGKFNIDQFIKVVSNYEGKHGRSIGKFIDHCHGLIEEKFTIPNGFIKSQKESITMITIHKAKGLEFPMVFLVGTNNERANSRSVVCDNEYGLGYSLVKNGYKYGNIHQYIIKEKKKMENLEDNLNMLYVAMTRARNLLYIIGSAKSQKKINKYTKENFFYMISYALEMDPKLDKFIEKINPELDEDIISSNKNRLKLVIEETGDKFFNREIDESIPRKISVTDLKSLGKEELYVRDYLKASFKSSDEFLNRDILTSAAKGTLYHLVMERLDLNLTYDSNEIKVFLNMLVEKEVISKTEAKYVKIETVLGFLNSSLGGRVRKSLEVYKETGFNLLIDYGELFGEEKNGKDILIQGVIDLYFKEDDKIVLVDYKTDYVTLETLNQKVESYKDQLNYYKMALEKIKKVEVKEAYLFFASIGKEVLVTL